ncbi:hypothetical protein IQ249_17085 [Lusitaniella coriacea LEGE 07157]|uniref:Uncharacterized protein n=1 Tax=Lusitaniella coriacea LEGE 07157 TaxID=945747 RepID=A0A8J7JCR7_9CYAN|nr:hypothetical protein [Lusitaniella coriacea]MBE9117615.1 hypothetical protein [Lusitaniella coriacea LEGE 07157]
MPTLLLSKFQKSSTGRGTFVDKGGPLNTKYEKAEITTGKFLAERLRIDVVRKKPIENSGRGHQTADYLIRHLGKTLDMMPKVSIKSSKR